MFFFHPTNLLDAGDEQGRPGHGAVEHLEGEVPVLAGQPEALHDAARQVLQRARRHAAVQSLVAAVPPANRMRKQCVSGGQVRRSCPPLKRKDEGSLSRDVAALLTRVQASAVDSNRGGLTHTVVYDEKKVAQIHF